MMELGTTRREAGVNTPFKDRLAGLAAGGWTDVRHGKNNRLGEKRGGPSQEGEGQIQRLEVSKEDLTQATNKLGLTGPPKSKTIQVMEECEKRGTAAPSVFGGRKSGPETTVNTHTARPVRK